MNHHNNCTIINQYNSKKGEVPTKKLPKVKKKLIHR